MSFRVLLLFFLASGYLLASEYPKHVGETLKKLGDNIYGVFGVYEQVSPENRGFISNAYFVVTSEGVLVVDVLSTYKLGKELVEAIKKTTDKPIKLAVITHYHTDHFYGIKALKEAGAITVAHEDAYEYLSQPSSEAFLKSRQRLLGKHMEGTGLEPPHITIDKDMTINLGGTLFEVSHICKGHTKGDLLVWMPKEGILFGGDLVFDGRLPFLGSGNSKSWIRCLDKILELKPKILLPGHGKPMLTQERILDRVRWTKKYITDLRNTIKRLMEEGYDVDYVRENINEELIKVDISYAKVPVFHSVNPVNAYYVYFDIEREILEGE